VPAAAGGTHAAATAPTSRSCSPRPRRRAADCGPCGALPARPATGPPADGPAADPNPGGPGQLSEWTPRPVQMDPAGAVWTPGRTHCGALRPSPLDSRTARVAAGCRRSAADHRHQPAWLPGCDAATVPASTTSPCWTVRCPRQPPGLAARTLRTWTAGHCARVAGRAPGRRAGAEPAAGDHDQGDEEPKPGARSSRDPDRAGAAFVRPPPTTTVRPARPRAHALGLGAFGGPDPAGMLGVVPGLPGQRPTLMGDASCTRAASPWTGARAAAAVVTCALNARPCPWTCSAQRAARARPGPVASGLGRWRPPWWRSSRATTRCRARPAGSLGRRTDGHGIVAS
jgi:hypothetical protein